jgi:hypothetical protein
MNSSLGKWAITLWVFTHMRCVFMYLHLISGSHNAHYEVYSLWGYNIMCFGKSLTFTSKSPPSSGLISKPSMKPAETAQLSICLCRLLAWRTLQPWKWRQYVNLKHHAPSELHGIRTQKAIHLTIFILSLCQILLWHNHSLWLVTSHKYICTKTLSLQASQLLWFLTKILSVFISHVTHQFTEINFRLLIIQLYLLV